MSFFSRNWRGVSVLTLGIGTMLITHFLLHDCADEGRFMTLANGMKAPMKCYWTERSVYGVAALIVVIGLVMLWQHESSRALSLVTAAAGALIIVTPLWLIGTCTDPMEPCNTSLKPGLIVLGLLTVVVGLTGAFQSRRQGGPGTVA
ncbi:MAG TPA: DUF4418 family protein [Symbiobacteriaceae bacterium]|jgi:hypothetical protein